jgi:mono/diheme cytochrome c family protein
MEFPIFQVPYLGNGMTIALNAVLHVVISHGIAIGVMTMVVIAEYFGLKKSSKDWENFSKDLLKPTILIITGVGAVTGVGIWLITSALSPRGIGSMLRIFFWPWFIEWVVFSLEVAVILVYYFTWDRWTGERKKRHVYLGFSYILLALCSAFLITGILGFMLTSNGWPWDQNFWPAFFNPSFLPQLLLRIGGALGLGSLFSIAFLLYIHPEKRFCEEALKFFGEIVLVSFMAMAAFSWWYFKIIPSTFKTHAIFSILTSHLSQHPEIFWLANGIAAILLFLFILSSARGFIFSSRILIFPAILIAVGFFGEFERIREFIRGPYLMPGYMYTNQILLKEKPLLDKEGALKNVYWYNITAADSNPIQEAAYLFALNCSACHTIGGMNEIKDRLRGRTEDGIFVLLAHAGEMVPFMPPFSGSEQERRVLANFLYQLANGKIKIKVPSRFYPLIEGESHD